MFGPSFEGDNKRQMFIPWISSLSDPMVGSSPSRVPPEDLKDLGFGHENWWSGVTVDPSLPSWSLPSVSLSVVLMFCDSHE